VRRDPASMLSRLPVRIIQKERVRIAWRRVVAGVAGVARSAAGAGSPSGQRPMSDGRFFTSASARGIRTSRMIPLNANMALLQPASRMRNRASTGATAPPTPIPT